MKSNSSSPVRHIRPLLLALVMLPLTGCVGIWGNHDRHEASSVVQFLYPDKNQPLIQRQIPTLRLPLRVGVAFIPPGSTYHADSGFTEQQKTDLLRQVAAQFKSQAFVQSIEIIPTTYLLPGGGFDNLDQLRGMMGIDVVVLIAYDQRQFSADTEASLAYWTIVGAYLVEGQRNTTHTLMEAVVYDIPSRSLLFRAPGTNSQKHHSTLVRTDEELRRDSATSLAEAAKQMTLNLAQELDLFKVRVKEEPDTVKIEHKPGYHGGGSVEAWFAAALGVLLAGRTLTSRSTFFSRPV
jgi:rhombotail lipoprotein